MEKKKSNIKKKNNKKVVENKSKKSEKNNFSSWLGKNIVSIICAIVGIGIGVLIMILAWPERIAKLSDGTEPILSVDNLTITANDLYEKLKTSNGLAAVLDMVDKNILDQEYSDKIMEEADNYAKETAQGYFENYQNYYGMSKEDFLSQNGFENEAAFVDYLKYDYIRNTWYSDYLKTLISEKDIEKFYKNEAFGTRDLIFISSAEDDKELKEVLKELKSGTSIDDVREKHSNLIYNDNSVTMSEISSYSKDIIKSVKSLKKGEYSNIIKDESYGYVILYATDAAELGKMEDIKADLIKAISAKMDAADSSLYYKSFEVLRDKYNLKFSDTSIEKAYKSYLKQAK